MRLPYTELFAIYRVVTPFGIPTHPGSLWRGVSGRALWAGGCAKQPVCQGSCELPAECLYRRLFKPLVPQPAPHRFLDKQSAAPPPLLPLFDRKGNRQMEVSDTFHIGLRCLGHRTARENECLGNLLAAIPQVRIGEDAGRVELVAVSEPRFYESSACARDSLAMARDPISARLRILTPLWLEKNRKLLTHIPFLPLFNDLMGRLTRVCSLYGVYEPDDDVQFYSLQQLAREVAVTDSRLFSQDWERRRTETGELLDLHGMLGHLTLHGPLLPLLPFLRMAEVAHLGKSTNLGLGRVQFELLQGPASNRSTGPEEPRDQAAFSLDPASSQGR